MSERVMRGGQIETPDSETMDEGTLPLPAQGNAVPAQGMAPTYIPTGVALIDSVLALADRMTGGKAGALQHVASYLIIGGFAACVNLATIYILNDRIKMPVAKNVQFIIAFLIANEISIMANFIPNDRFTFSHMPGHARSWWARCLRFHSTCIAGVIVTFVVSYVLHIWFGLHTLVAQSIAILIALVFNFTMHHIWTYRRVGTAH